MRRKLQQFSLVAAAAVPFLFMQSACFSAEDTPPQATCKAVPQEQGKQSQTDASPDASLLADCNGVLHPPAVGDPDLVKPAPNVGKMPVIPPGSVPQNGGNGDGGLGNTK